MKYLTTRIVFGVAALVLLAVLTAFYPEWLIVPLSIAAASALAYLTYVVIGAIVDNKWPW